MDGVPPFILEVYKIKGAEYIFTVRMTPLDEEGDEAINTALNGLYMEAFRRVRRPDETIRELFDTIQRSKSTPF